MQNNALEFLLDVLGTRHPGHRGSILPSPELVAEFARRRAVSLPALGWDGDDEERWAATGMLRELRDSLAISLLGDDAAGREELNVLMSRWNALPALEVDVGPNEAPGLDLDATALPPAPLSPIALAHEGAAARSVAINDKQLTTFLTAVASTLLTLAVSIHLRGQAHRVRACGSSDCWRPFHDTSDAGVRRYCSATCRAREWARRPSGRT